MPGAGTAGRGGRNWRQLLARQGLKDEAARGVAWGSAGQVSRDSNAARGREDSRPHCCRPQVCPAWGREPVWCNSWPPVVVWVRCRTFRWGGAALSIEGQRPAGCAGGKEGADCDTPCMLQAWLGVCRRACWGGEGGSPHAALFALRAELLPHLPPELSTDAVTNPDKANESSHGRMRQPRRL
jgi:hypothetical protein